MCRYFDQLHRNMAQEINSAIRSNCQWKKVEVKVSDKLRRRLPVDATEDISAMEGWVCRDSKKEFQEVLQHDMWGVEPSDRWDWDALRAIIAKNGLRNSLPVAPMPTASTSQILGDNECFEPYTSNIYTRSALRSGVCCGEQASPL
ncbi:hypothetical protein OROHE_004479 [Orobanche hederae]